MNQPQRDEDATPATGGDADSEREPTDSGHSTADDQTERNQEDESPS